MGKSLAINPASSAAAIDIERRLGSLAASSTVTNQELTVLWLQKNNLSSTVAQLESQLATTLEITLTNLRSRLERHSNSEQAAASTTFMGVNPMRPLPDVRVVLNGIYGPPPASSVPRLQGNWMQDAGADSLL
jgi:hypothetical protein